MDIFNNVLEGTRQFFMGVPKQVQAEGSGPSVWPPSAPLPEEGAPAQSGAPAPSSRPPSAAAAPPAPAATPVPVPPRPLSEPLEPEPHIIHKATVMREAAEKRRELPEIEDEEEPSCTLSPPTHIIRKPQRALQSPAPAPAAPCPSPARPPSAAPLPPPSVPEQQIEPQYRPSAHRVQTPTTARPPDHFATGRPPDPYGPSRPPEPYPRYHYESNVETGRNSHGPIASPQPSVPTRQSPHSYARMTNTMPQHTASRLRETATHSPPAQRYVMPTAQPPPPHNDRVPPIHHPQTVQRHIPVDNRSPAMYASLPQRRDTSPYARAASHYDRHPVATPRKYDPQQAYSGYRPSTTVPQSMHNHRVDMHHQVQYKPVVMEAMNTHYSTRPPDRASAPPQPQHDTARLPSRGDYARTAEGRVSYRYSVPSTSTSRYGPAATPPVVQSTSLSRAPYRSAAAPKSNYIYPTSTPVQTSPARSTVKPGYPNQKARMTVSVTSIVNEINETKQKQGPPVPITSTQVNSISQTKQKRESPLDLSVKTVKNSADSSTTQDDVVDSMSIEHKTLPLNVRPSSSTRVPHAPLASYVGSHKVDFSPNFTQYGERNPGPIYSSTPPSVLPVRYNGAYEPRRAIAESYPTESPNQSYPERKYNVHAGRNDSVPKIDLTRPVVDQPHPESRIRDDRHFIIEERKRPAGPIVSNIPDKIRRFETWTADSPIEHMNPSAREQHELLSRPVYSYSSHKQCEAYRNEQKRTAPPLVYREMHPHANHRYTLNNYPSDTFPRETRDYQSLYHDRNPPISSRHQVIQKIPSHREVQSHHIDPHSGIPADKRVLSILRNSLETKQSNFTESPRSVKQIPDLIVIDDVDDSIIEITDLTKDNESESASNVVRPAQTGNHLAANFGHHHIKMPRAVDSIPRESDNQKPETNDAKSKTPENDVAARIRTKAELKVMPPTQDNTVRTETKSNSTLSENDKTKILPKSQKQHLFNQIRQDNLRLESVIKSEKLSDTIIPEIKTEPMNIDEIERDAEISIKTEDFLEDIEPNNLSEDLDWASACDNFMEQLKSGQCHKKKNLRRRVDTLDQDSENKAEKENSAESLNIFENPMNAIQIKQEPIDEDEINLNVPSASNDDAHQNENEEEKSPNEKDKTETENNLTKIENKNVSVKCKKSHIKSKIEKRNEKNHDKPNRIKTKLKAKSVKHENLQSTTKKETIEKEPLKTVIKEELESTDDDEPLIKSKILKEKKEHSERMKYQFLKDLSEKSAYVKLECCDVDVNKNNRKSVESMPKESEETQNCKVKLSRQSSRSKIKSSTTENNKSEKQDVNSSSDSDDDLSVAIRLRKRKNTKTDDGKVTSAAKTSVKSSPKKTDNSSASCSSTPVRKPGFGDGSDFHPGWEEELYKYKRSLRMPTRLIAIPRGRSGGPFVKRSGTLFTRGSTSLPDLDPAPLSPAPSSAPSAATDDIYARRQDKHTLDSDLDSNSSCSAPNRLHYDSEASTSTVFSSSKAKCKNSSIVDVLIQKCGKKDETKKKSKDKDDRIPKLIPKSTNATELLPTPSLGLGRNGTKGILSVRKEKIMEDIFYLGAFRKETVTAFRNAFIENSGGIIGATEEFAPVILKSRTRTESRVLKQRATIKEVFGDERPASAPPTSYRAEDIIEEKETPIIKIKKEPEAEAEPKPKFKPKKMIKDKLQRRSSSIRDGLRSTKSLKRNDAKGRLLRLKKRNSLMNSLNSKKIKELSNSKHKSEFNAEDKSKPKEESSSLGATEGNTKRRLKRLFGRRKFSSGFDYIRKKKKIIRREDAHARVRRPAVKPSPESVHDIQKEIKSWFINKSIGETHLHRAARLGYTDCVAYCLEKMESDPSAKDNAGFTPLHVAAAKGHVRIARLLLQYGSNVSAAAQGGIRPLHEACENCHVEVIRLLLGYGADPLLGTYAGQTPEELAEGPAALLLRLHIADVQGYAVEPWRFPPPTEIIDRDELGGDALSSPPPSSPPPPPDSMIEIQCTEAPLPPFYTLRTTTGQPADGLWCLLQDITNILQIKSKDSLLKQIHCGSGSPKELLREIRTQEFLERAQCQQLLCSGEKVNVRASKVALVRVTDKLRQLLKIETVLVS